MIVRRTSRTRTASMPTGALIAGVFSFSWSSDCASCIWGGSTKHSDFSVGGKEKGADCRSWRQRHTCKCAYRDLLTYDMNECGIGTEANVGRWEEDLGHTAVDVRVCGCQSRHGDLQNVHIHLSCALQRKHNNGRSCRMRAAVSKCFAVVWERVISVYPRQCVKEMNAFRPSRKQKMILLVVWASLQNREF